MQPEIENEPINTYTALVANQKVCYSHYFLIVKHNNGDDYEHEEQIKYRLIIPGWTSKNGKLYSQ